MNKFGIPSAIKMSLLLSGLAACLLFAVLWVTCMVVRERNLERVLKEAKTRQLKANTQIDRMINAVELAIEDHVWSVEHNLQNPEVLKTIPEQVVAANPMIFGSSLAFRPHFFSSIGEYFMVYSYRDGKGVIRNKDLGGPSYDYFFMDWYQIPRILKTNYWSEPFFDLGGGNMLMVTYSRPLYDKKGDFLAIFSADISLNWLKKLVLSNNVNTHCYTFMLSRNGYYLVHPNANQVINETIFSAIINVNDSERRSISEKMIAGKSAHETFTRGDTLLHIVFSGIPRTGWSLGTVCRGNSLWKALGQSSWYIIVLCICSVVIQSVLIFFIVIRMYRKFLGKSKTVN